MKKKKKTAPSKGFRRLYEFAADIRRLAPWQWMEESDTFGVKDPADGRVYFVSVMGMLGVHKAVSAYPDIEALCGIMEGAEEDLHHYPEKLLEVPQLQLSFENREEISEHAYKTIRSLGLRFRGEHAWPQFESYRPGYMPWRLDQREIQAMTAVLEQLCDVAPRFREDPSLLDFQDPDMFLVRVRSNQEKNGWRDEPRRFPEPDLKTPPAPVPELAVARLQKLERSADFLELDFFMVPAQIGKKGSRPQAGYALMAVEEGRGMIVVMEILTAEPSLRAMWDRLPEVFAGHLAKAGFLPGGVVVRSPLLVDLLAPFFEALGLELYESEVLPNLDPAKQSMIEHMMRG